MARRKKTLWKNVIATDTGKKKTEKKVRKKCVMHFSRKLEELQIRNELNKENFRLQLKP